MRWRKRRTTTTLHVTLADGAAPARRRDDGADVAAELERLWGPAWRTRAA